MTTYKSGIRNTRDEDYIRSKRVSKAARRLKDKSGRVKFDFAHSDYLRAQAHERRKKRGHHGP